LRITGGRLRGRRLAALKGREIRPTSDRVREALFSMVGQDLSGISVMDLFAGTGALGIEALSRGAQSAVFVDKSSRAVGLIRRNVTICGLEEASRTVRWDLTKGLPAQSTPPEGPFRLVFMDPPYGLGLTGPVLDSLGSSGILAPGALVIAETGSGDPLHVPEKFFSLLQSRTYGDTGIHLLNLKRSRQSETAEEPSRSEMMT
jgi:16S rRNA (guanine966-N2)-methyltransferase